MKRLLLVLSLTALMVLSVAGVASAGEIKGPPGPEGAEGDATPIAGFWTGDGAASICSFSGLNDHIDDFETTQTQSFGTFMVMVRERFELTTHEAQEFLGGTPAAECNPNNAPWPHPKKGGPGGQ